MGAVRQKPRVYTAPICVSCRVDLRGQQQAHFMACCEYAQRPMPAQVAFPSTLCVHGHVSPSVSIYLFSTLALYYTKASLSATLPHIAVFSTIYPQAYLSTITFPQVIHRLIHKIILQRFSILKQPGTSEIVLTLQRTKASSACPDHHKASIKNQMKRLSIQ